MAKKKPAKKPTPAKPPTAPKPPKPSKPPLTTPGTAASPPEPTGRRMVAGKNPITGAPQGQLVANVPGSNGGVRRGPDLQPRNLVKALILKALADEGRVVTEEPVNGKKLDWRRQPKVRHALVHNASRGLQRVFEDMAEGDQDAYGHGIRALGMMNEVLAPSKDEQKGYGLGGPIAPRFTRPAQPSPGAAAAPGPEALVVDAEGTAYVDGDA